MAPSLSITSRPAWSAWRYAASDREIAESGQTSLAAIVLLASGTEAYCQGIGRCGRLHCLLKVACGIETSGRMQIKTAFSEPRWLSRMVFGEGAGKKVVFPAEHVCLCQAGGIILLQESDELLEHERPAPASFGALP